MTLTYEEVVCLDDFDPFARETTSDLQNYTQDIYHSIVQAYASNPDAPDAGAGIDNVLSSTMTPVQIQNLCVGECRKDPRTVSASCRATQADDGTMSVALEADTDDDHLSATITFGVDGTAITVNS